MAKVVHVTQQWGYVLEHGWYTEVYFTLDGQWTRDYNVTSNREKIREICKRDQEERVFIGAPAPDPVFLRRVGDFYEAYGEAAERFAKATGAVVTYRDGQAMTAIPHQCFETYLMRCIQAGLYIHPCEPGMWEVGEE